MVLDLGDQQVCAHKFAKEDCQKYEIVNYKNEAEALADGA